MLRGPFWTPCAIFPLPLEYRLAGLRTSGLDAIYFMLIMFVFFTVLIIFFLVILFLLLLFSCLPSMVNERIHY